MTYKDFNSLSFVEQHKLVEKHKRKNEGGYTRVLVGSDENKTLMRVKKEEQVVAANEVKNVSLVKKLSMKISRR